MVRRLVTTTLIAALALVVAAPAVHAVSSRTRLCISASRKARKNCVVTCGTDFQNSYVNCFGPGADCAALCLQQQSDCLLGPVTARTACEKDTDPNPSDGVVQGACSDRLRAALECCADSTCTAAQGRLDPDPIACASKARIQGIQCNDDCVLLYAPQVQGCNSGFNDCTASCASCRDASQCPFAQQLRELLER
jgi:hypothetical protein